MTIERTTPAVPVVKNHGTRGVNAPTPNKCLITTETVLARSSVSAPVIGLSTPHHKEKAVTPIITTTPIPAKSQVLGGTPMRLALSAAVAAITQALNDNRRLGIRHPK